MFCPAGDANNVSYRSFSFFRNLELIVNSSNFQILSAFQDDSGKSAEKFDVDGAYAPRMFFIGLSFCDILLSCYLFLKHFCRGSLAFKLVEIKVVKTSSYDLFFKRKWCLCEDGEEPSLH